MPPEPSTGWKLVCAGAVGQVNVEPEPSVQSAVQPAAAVAATRYPDTPEVLLEPRFSVPDLDFCPGWDAGHSGIVDGDLRVGPLRDRAAEDLGQDAGFQLQTFSTKLTCWHGVEDADGSKGKGNMNCAPPSSLQALPTSVRHGNVSRAKVCQTCSVIVVSDLGELPLPGAASHSAVSEPNVSPGHGHKAVHDVPEELRGVRCATAMDFKSLCYCSMHSIRRDRGHHSNQPHLATEASC